MFSYIEEGLTRGLDDLLVRQVVGELLEGLLGELGLSVPRHFHVSLPFVRVLLNACVHEHLRASTCGIPAMHTCKEHIRSKHMKHARAAYMHPSHVFFMYVRASYVLLACVHCKYANENAHNKKKTLAPPSRARARGTRTEP